MSDRRVTHISHPILRLEVLHPDGTRSSQHRVFCRYQNRSVPAGTCCACVHCDAINTAPIPTVNCTVAMEASALEPDPQGTHTAVGGVLQKGTLVLDPGTTIRQALSLLQSEDRRSVAVVDVNSSIIGVVHEAAFLPKPVLPKGAAERPEDAVARVMSGSLAIHEKVPIRRALELLAAAHLREATVVDDGGIPLGVFRDIDGLRWLFKARKDVGEATAGASLESVPFE